MDRNYPPAEPDNEEGPSYEAEDCESCKAYMEKNDIEYTRDCHWNGQTWICDHCGQPL